MKEFQENLYNLIIISIYLLYFFIFFNISDSAPMYLVIIDGIFKLYVCIFLIVRFNPFRKIVSFNYLDRKVAFSAGLFLFTSNVLNTPYFKIMQSILL